MSWAGPPGSLKVLKVSPLSFLSFLRLLSFSSSFSAFQDIGLARPQPHEPSTLSSSYSFSCSSCSQGGWGRLATSSHSSSYSSSSSSQGGGGGWSPLAIHPPTPSPPPSSSFLGGGGWQPLRILLLLLLLLLLSGWRGRLVTSGHSSSYSCSSCSQGEGGGWSLLLMHPPNLFSG